MKKTFTISLFSIATLVLSSAFIIKDSTGKAGYTGAPGETTCAAGGCHGGGSSASPTVFVTASPAFTNDEYVPGTVYTVSVNVGATGFTRFGFDCEILNSSNTDIGLMQTAGSGVKFLTAGGRKNATHTSPKLGSTGQTAFTFQWVAPVAGEGDAVFYYCANAVNLNANVTGDLPMPGSYTLTEGAPTNTTNIKEVSANSANIAVYPNPASSFVTVSYSVKGSETITVDLLDINGKKVKTLFEGQGGTQEKTASLQGVAKGVYFVKASSGGAKLSQKLLVVN